MNSIDHIQCSGYIEGYYGRLLEWRERHALLDQLSRLDLSSYFYAPKEDTYHRLQWREPYPVEWRRAFALFTEHAQKTSIHIIAGVAPGLDFNFKHISDGDDFKALVFKAKQLLEDGASAIALLMDDINVVYNNDAGFKSEGEAHAVLANALADAIGQSVFTVPRVYANELEHESPGYTNGFCRHLHASHVIFHCGTHIVAPSVQAADYSAYQIHKQHRVAVWDNLYANDYCPRRLFIGPWVGRSKRTEVMLNPTGMLATDALLLDIMVKSAATNGTEAALQAVWASTLRDHKVPACFESVQAYFKHPPFLSADNDNDGQTVSMEDKFAAIEELLWKWKSPLSREWYPYLFGLKHDLSLSQGLLNESRIRKTQPEPLSGLLLAKTSTLIDE